MGGKRGVEIERVTRNGLFDNGGFQLNVRGSGSYGFELHCGMLVVAESRKVEKGRSNNKKESGVEELGKTFEWSKLKLPTTDILHGPRP